MKKTSFYYIRLLLKCWLIAIACPLSEWTLQAENKSELKRSNGAQNSHSLASFLSNPPPQPESLIAQADINEPLEAKPGEDFHFTAPLPILRGQMPEKATEEKPATEPQRIEEKTTQKSVRTTQPSSPAAAPITTKRTVIEQERTIEEPQRPEMNNTRLPTQEPARLQQPIPRIEPIFTPPAFVQPVPSAAPSAPFPEITEVGSINFNNVAMVEYIRFVSRISNKNFVFDEEDLLFNVTIVSEEPTSVDNLMAALLQELRIRDLFLIEQGNNLIIHRNPRVRAPARVVLDGTEHSGSETELVTRVFRLNTLDPVKAGEIIKPLLSDDALVEVLRDSNNLIITDLVSNVNKIADLISKLDAPNSGVTVGQYVVKNAFVASLADLATKLLQPIAQGNPFLLVPHSSTNSIFIVSNSFIVEKALAILENLDINEGRTKILPLDKLRFQDLPGAGAESGRLGTSPLPGGPVPSEQLDQFGNPIYNIPGTPGYNPNLPTSFPPGYQGGIGVQGRDSIIFDENTQFLPGGIGTNPRWMQDLPPGHIERTLFFIYKLKYRRGDQLEIALRRIAESLAITGVANLDLVAAINSSQWLEGSNSLIFTGTVAALERIKELVLEIDIPLHQVFIEMLILDTTIADSLTYGVDWGTRFGGPNAAGGQNFLGAGPALAASLLNGEIVSEASNILTVDNGLTGDGYTAGIIGRSISRDGLSFNTIGALVRAIHTDAKTNIILNPKIITEDNNTAEIFVGSTERYKTQSIANDLGSVITNNFQFIDVGTTLRVTPMIGNNGIITLDIIEEVTNGTGDAANSGNISEVDFNLIPVLSKSRTVTRIHVPNGFFVILSGMIQSTETTALSRIPCLGGIPIIGGISKNKRNLDNKRNLMIFIRPLIVDTEEELENITKRQQDVYREKSKFRRSWNYEIDEALDFLSIRPADPDEIGCTIK
ncbi:MAG: type III secretion protein [Parachlamydia sp.]|nr:type III secretion protein [Parachlamydia sp.]